MATNDIVQLQKRPLGRTNLSVTPIGLGGAYLGCRWVGDQHFVDENLAIATVRRALELGINLIDTSAGYMDESRSEKIIGTALSEWYAQGHRREDLVLSTKTGTREHCHCASAYTATATWRSVEQSLKFLKTDYLDIILVHDPPSLSPVLAPNGAWKALNEMKAQGLVRAIGLGVRDHAFHQQLIATGQCDVCLTYLDYNLLRQTAIKGVLDPASKHGAAVLNATSLYHGLLSGADPLAVAQRSHLLGTMLKRDVARAHSLWQWCQERDIDLLALNLQFCTREPRIASTLMGAATPQQIERDAAALSTEIPESTWQELSQRFQIPTN